MSVCTFQPNLPRHALSSGGASQATESIGSKSRFEPPQDGAGSGGIRGGTSGSFIGKGLDRDGITASTYVSDGGEKGKQWPEVSRTERSFPSKRTSVMPAETAVAQRLYDETKRLDERRFEGQERKRMAEEEVYARTCTFEVGTGMMIVWVACVCTA